MKLRNIFKMEYMVTRGGNHTKDHLVFYVGEDSYFFSYGDLIAAKENGATIINRDEDGKIYYYPTTRRYLVQYLNLNQFRSLGVKVKSGEYKEANLKDQKLDWDPSKPWG